MVTTRPERGKLKWLLTILLGLDFGLVFAAWNYAALRHADIDTAQTLLLLKTSFSAVLGRVFGWDEYVVAVDPIGLWLQQLVVAVVVGPLAILVLRGLVRRVNWPLAERLMPGVIAVAMPWVCLAVMVDGWTMIRPTEAFHFLVVMTPIIAVSLSVRAVYTISSGRFRAHRVEVVLVIFANLAAALAFSRDVEWFGMPIVHAAGLICVGVLALWGATPDHGRREPLG